MSGSYGRISHKRTLRDIACVVGEICGCVVYVVFFFDGRAFRRGVSRGSRKSLAALMPRKYPAHNNYGSYAGYETEI